MITSGQTLMKFAGNGIDDDSNGLEMEQHYSTNPIIHYSFFFTKLTRDEN